MLPTYFFILGLVNSVSLIIVFMLRRNNLAVLKRFGWVYLLLAVPALYGIVLAVWEKQSARYIIFLGIFLVFLLFEGLLDFVWKIDFRSGWRQNWRYLAPYLALYYAMNYGFVVMPWKTSLAWGLVMVGLFIVQMASNLGTHPH